MLCDLCFMLRDGFTVVVVVVGARDFEEKAESSAEPRSLTAHPLTTTHLVALALFPYAQIVSIYSATFVSYWVMHFLLWLLCLVPATEFWLVRLAAYGRPPAHNHTPGRLVTLSCMAKSF
jgi:hypothetical protein